MHIPHESLDPYITRSDHLLMSSAKGPDNLQQSQECDTFQMCPSKAIPQIKTLHCTSVKGRPVTCKRTFVDCTIITAHQKGWLFSRAVRHTHRPRSTATSFLSIDGSDTAAASVFLQVPVKADARLVTFANPFLPHDPPHFMIWYTPFNFMETVRNDRQATSSLPVQCSLLSYCLVPAVKWVWAEAGHQGSFVRMRLRVLPECLAHSKATCSDGNEGGRLLRMTDMCGSDASAVPSTTSITTSPSNEGIACAHTAIT